MNELGLFDFKSKYVYFNGLERMNDSFKVRTLPKVGMILFGCLSNFYFLEERERECIKMTTKEII